VECNSFALAICFVSCKLAGFGLDRDFTNVLGIATNYYVPGHIHTNEVENFWSLLNRGLHVPRFQGCGAPKCVFRKQVFRSNHRDDCNEAGRFIQMMSQIAGRRLTYAELTTRQSCNVKRSRDAAFRSGFTPHETPHPLGELGKVSLGIHRFLAGGLSLYRVNHRLLLVGGPVESFLVPEEYTR